MTFRVIDAVRNANLDSLTAAIGSGGFLQIYSGSEPASAGTALSGNTLLAELPLSSPFAGAAANGVLTANAITTANAIADGTATFYRLTNSSKVAVAQAAVGGAELALSSTTITTGSPISVSSLVINDGNG